MEYPAAVPGLQPETGGLFWRGLVIACAMAVPLWSLLIYGLYRMF